MKTQKMGILFRSCKSDSTRKQQIVAASTQKLHSLLKTYMGNSGWMAEWHEEESKENLHERQFLPISPDLCLTYFI